MTTQSKDLMDTYVTMLQYEISKELIAEWGNQPISRSTIGEKVEKSVLAAMEHEANLENPNFLTYVEINTKLTKWYKETLNRYSDHFMEILPQCAPYLDNPEQYANIWGNLSSQMIGVIVGNIREDGL